MVNDDDAMVDLEYSLDEEGTPTPVVAVRIPPEARLTDFDEEPPTDPDARFCKGWRCTCTSAQVSSRETPPWSKKDAASRFLVCVHSADGEWGWCQTRQETMLFFGLRSDDR